jgi:dihydroneopterin aldolase
MDILSIEQLKITATIGVNDWERQIKQVLFFDLQWEVDAAKVAATDQISQATDYAAISQALQTFVEASAFLLIETLAENSAQFLLSTFKFEWLKLKLSKPGADNHAKEVSITIERRLNVIHNRECNGHENTK